ncbi:hypothetical protein RND71_006063 [Anisodus tanguticus]|uniref:Glucose-methanol-choline oxidoreductase N-terminal domain-containing protein n=1 Tax=Anisodus tanguticus TaxID=243964 RepID=A0AAE1VSX0_9SOLA|nr:hypothetical protein RND71_006063 [Anisodus tanguticus]
MQMCRTCKISISLWLTLRLPLLPKFLPQLMVCLMQGLKSWAEALASMLVCTVALAKGTIFERFGRRKSAAELLTSANPEKLHVLVHATVQKIEFETSGKKPRAVGVVFKDEKGNQHKAFLSSRRGSEIIVSSGGIGSPQILMLSGIGPKSELEKMNISVVLDNKFVGRHVRQPLKHHICSHKKAC